MHQALSNTTSTGLVSKRTLRLVIRSMASFQSTKNLWQPVDGAKYNFVKQSEVENLQKDLAVRNLMNKYVSMNKRN